MPIPTKQLKRGSKDEQVRELQRFLNQQGFMVAEVGKPGSPGNETTFFGPATERALQQFQTAQGIVSSGSPTTTGFGRLGPKTLKAVTSIGEKAPETLVDVSVPYWEQKAREAEQAGDKNLAQFYRIRRPTTEGADRVKEEVEGKVSSAAPVEEPEEKVIPETFKGDTEFAGLPAELQDFLIVYLDILETNDAEAQKIMAEALEEARAQADPYFAEIIRVAQDELTRAITGVEASLGDKEEQIKTRIERIKEDLATGRGRLTIDEQAELGRQKKRFEVELEGLQETIRHMGLTFSTKRKRAEERLEAGQTDIVESTQRRFQREIQDLERRAQRGEADAIKELATKRRVTTEGITSLVRAAEKELGTTGLPDVPTGAALGDISGTLQETKTRDIFERATALASLRNPFI